MSTPATIQIEGIDSVKVYKHYDGDPQSTLPWLNFFNKEFSELMGERPDYKLAQLLRSSVRDGSMFNLDPSKFLGWGVVGFDEMEVYYNYILKGDGEVVVEDCDVSN